MSTHRKFNFPFATLTHNAGLLGSALADDAYQPAMEERLGADFVATFPLKITGVTCKSTAQSSQTGDISSLTIQQQADYKEMERLAGGARRSARLAFPGQDTLLNAEFQVGEGAVKAISAVIGRAGLTHAAALKYAAELQAKGWVAKDTAALGTAAGKLKDVGTEHENASDERLGLTDEKIIKANDLYHDCLVIQNAARLEYPGGKDAAGNARNITGRARFLLDEFPPRDRSQPDGGTQGGTAPPTPPAP